MPSLIYNLFKDLQDDDGGKKKTNGNPLPVVTVDNMFKVRKGD